MQGPIIFNFKTKTVTRAGDPSTEKALRELVAAQKKVVMTGPGIAQSKPAR